MVPEFGNRLGYVEEEREESRIKMSVADLAFSSKVFQKKKKKKISNQTNLLLIIISTKPKLCVLNVLDEYN